MIIKRVSYTVMTWQLAPGFAVHLSYVSTLTSVDKGCSQSTTEHVSSLVNMAAYSNVKDAVQNAVITKCSLQGLHTVSLKNFHDFPWPPRIITCVSYAEPRNVHPSIRPSVTRWHCIKAAERMVMISSPHDSPFILVMCVPRSSRNSDGVTPCGGAKYRWGIKFAQFSTNKLLYLANDTRYRHGCYGRRIGNHTQAFEWHQFQWPWETSKSDFKVTILFNVK